MAEITARERVARTATQVVQARVNAQREKEAEQRARQESEAQEQEEQPQEEKYVIVGQDKASKRYGTRETVLESFESEEAAKKRLEEKIPLTAATDARGRSIYYGSGYDNIFVRKTTEPVEVGKQIEVTSPLTKVQERAQRGKGRGLEIQREVQPEVPKPEKRLPSVLFKRQEAVVDVRTNQNVPYYQSTQAKQLEALQRAIREKPQRAVTASSVAEQIIEPESFSVEAQRRANRSRTIEITGRETAGELIKSLPDSLRTPENIRKIATEQLKQRESLKRENGYIGEYGRDLSILGLGNKQLDSNNILYSPSIFTTKNIQVGESQNEEQRLTPPERFKKEGVVINPSDPYSLRLRKTAYNVAVITGSAFENLFESAKAKPIRTGLEIGALYIGGGLVTKGLTKFGLKPAIAARTTALGGLGTFLGLKEKSQRGSVLSLPGAIGTATEAGAYGLLFRGVDKGEAIVRGTSFSKGKVTIQTEPNKITGKVVSSKKPPIVKDAIILSETIAPRTEPVMRVRVQQSTIKKLPQPKIYDVQVIDVGAKVQATKSAALRFSTSNLGQSIIQVTAPLVAGLAEAGAAIGKPVTLGILGATGRKRLSKAELRKQSFNARSNPNIFVNKPQGEVGVRITNPDLIRQGTKSRVIAKDIQGNLRITDKPTGADRAGLTSVTNREGTQISFREQGTLQKKTRKDTSQSLSEVRQAQKKFFEDIGFAAKTDSGSLVLATKQGQLILSQKSKSFPFQILKGKVPEQSFVKREIKTTGSNLQLASPLKEPTPSIQTPKVQGGFRKGVRERIEGRIRARYPERFQAQGGFQLIGEPYTYDFILPPQANKGTLGFVPALRQPTILKSAGATPKDVQAFLSGGKPTIITKNNLVAGARRITDLQSSLKSRLAQSRRIATRPSLDTEIIPIVGIGSRLDARIDSRIAQDVAIIPITDLAVAQDNILSPIQIQQQEQINDLILTPSTPSKFTPTSTPPRNTKTPEPNNPFKPNIPKTPIKTPPRKPPIKPLIPRVPIRTKSGLSEQSISNLGLTPANSYKLQVRRGDKRGDKFITVEKRLPQNLALQKGIQATDNYIEASFRLVPSKSPPKQVDVQTTPNLSKYRRPVSGSKLPRNTFIEKESNRLDTSGEINQISFFKQQKLSSLKAKRDRIIFNLGLTNIDYKTDINLKLPKTSRVQREILKIAKEQGAIVTGSFAQKTLLKKSRNFTDIDILSDKPAKLAKLIKLKTGLEIKKQKINSKFNIYRAFDKKGKLIADIDPLRFAEEGQAKRFGTIEVEGLKLINLKGRLAAKQLQLARGKKNLKIAKDILQLKKSRLKSVSFFSGSRGNSFKDSSLFKVRGVSI